jgi:hypothetical protein
MDAESLKADFNEHLATTGEREKYVILDPCPLHWRLFAILYYLLIIVLAIVFLNGINAPFVD